MGFPFNIAGDLAGGLLGAGGREETTSTTTTTTTNPPSTTLPVFEARQIKQNRLPNIN